MKYIWTFLVLAVLHQAVSSQAQDINEMFRIKTCEGDTFPRIVNFKNCRQNGPDFSKMIAECYDCVPEGVDSICREHGYLRAFLTSKLSPFNCELGQTNRMECPMGSDCVQNPYSAGHGICCYGTKSNNSVPADGTCNCIEECGPNNFCREFVDRCGKKQLLCN